MSEFFILDISRTCVIIIGTIIFAIVCSKRHNLISWLYAYIAATLSEIFRLIAQERYDIYEITGLGFSSLTLVLIIIAVSHDYYITFYKESESKIIPLFLLSIIQQIITIGLQTIIGFLLFFALFLILRIYVRNRSPTYAFLGFIIVCGIINLVAIALRDMGIDGAEEFYQFSALIMATDMLLTGLVALIEERLVKSENKYRLAYNRAEFYKDLFVHDINNILQNLQFSLEIISQNLKGYEKKEELDELLKIAVSQVKRGADLGLNVKKLSDLEMGLFKNEPVEIYKVLDQATDDIKAKFSEEQIQINIFGEREKIMVNANVLLEDVFRIILNNAIIYNDNSIKEIQIEICKEVKDYGSNIRIEFKDNGVGIPDTMKGTIFQPVHKKTKSFKRIGLGLLLVNEVIRSLSGKIWVEDKIHSDYTRGSNVVILIPEAYDILDIER